MIILCLAGSNIKSPGCLCIKMTAGKQQEARQPCLSHFIDSSLDKHALAVRSVCQALLISGVDTIPSFGRSDSISSHRKTKGDAQSPFYFVPVCTEIYPVQSTTTV